MFTALRIPLVAVLCLVNSCSDLGSWSCVVEQYFCESSPSWEFLIVSDLTSHLSGMHFLRKSNSQIQLAVPLVLVGFTRSQVILQTWRQKKVILKHAYFFQGIQSSNKTRKYHCRVSSSVCFPRSAYTPIVIEILPTGDGNNSSVASTVAIGIRL
jgi:hypothetical protein